MKQFDIRLTNNQPSVDGSYTIYYYIGTAKYVAKKYNLSGTAILPA